MRWLFVFLILLLALVIRWEYDLSSSISHDDVISVVTAQGNVPSYENAKKTLANRWVSASEWKFFFEKTSNRSLSGIGDDLAKHDIHPPLYFWLLRGWLQVFGPENAKALNLPIVLLAAAALFAFVRQSYGTSTALLAVAIWLLSPQTIRVSVFVRQYELLGLITVLIALQTVRIAKGKTCKKNLAIFATLALLGMLTQYIAAFAILTGFFVILREHRATGSRLVVFLCVAAILFVALHPGFYQQLGAHSGTGDFLHRIRASASTFLGFYGWRPNWTTTPIAAVVVGCAAILLGTGTYWLIKGRSVVCLFIAPALFLTLAVYLLGLIPSFSARHISFAWPFVAAAHAILIYRLRPKVLTAALAGLAFLLGPAEAYVAHVRYTAVSKSARPLPKLIQSAKHIVITNTATGILPRYLLYASDDTMIYASPGLDEGLPALPAGTIIIVNPQYLKSQTAAKAEAIAAGNGKNVFHAWTTKVFRASSD